MCDKHNDLKYSYISTNWIITTVVVVIILCVFSIFACLDIHAKDKGIKSLIAQINIIETEMIFANKINDNMKPKDFIKYRTELFTRRITYYNRFHHGYRADFQKLQLQMMNDDIRDHCNNLVPGGG